MRDLKRSILDYDAETLAAIAASRGMDAPADAEALRDEVARQGSGRLSLGLLWEGLADPEREALVRLAAAGGAIRAAYFEADYGALRSFGPGRLVREHLWEHPANLTERLYFLGVIFRGFEESGEAAVWYVPSDVLAALPVPAQDAGSADLPAPAAAAAEASAPTASVALALLHVLIAAREGRRRPPQAAAARLALEAADLDEERLRWLARLSDRLAQDLGFVSGGRVTPSGRSRARRWLALGHHEAVHQVALAWLASEWNELRQAPGLVYEGGRLPAARPARAALVGSLAAFEPGAWYAVQELKQWLRRRQPGFLRANADFDSLYVRDAASGEPLDGIAAWMGVEGRFVDEVLFALSGLEAVALGHSGDARLFSVATTAWWRRQAPGAAAAALPLALENGLALTAGDDAGFGHLYQVETFSEPAGRGRYTITRASLQHAERQGVGIDAVCAFLRRYAGAGDDALARVRRLLQPPQVAAEPLVALACDDPAALDAILLEQDADAAVHRLADGRVVISRDAWRLLADRLRALGWRLEGKR